MFSCSMLLGVVENITRVIGRFLYGCFGGILIGIIDAVQHIFRMIAGLDGGMSIEGMAVGTEENSYDIVYYLFGTSIIREIFLSMIIFSFFLLIIMTVLSLIRNQYQEKQRSATAILGSMFTAMINTIIFTAFVVLGLMCSNFILQFVDAGTSFGGSGKLSTTVFMSATYEANKLRINEGLVGDDLEDELKDARKALKNIVKKTNFAEYNDRTRTLCNNTNVNSLTRDDFNELAGYLDTAFCTGQIIMGGEVLMPSDTWDTGTLYNLMDCNYLVLVAGGCIVISILVKMSWGLIGRLFKLCFDFVLIPICHAMIPFDDGAAVKSLKGDVVKNVTMAYVPVGTLNLYFSILPIIETIKLTDGFLSGLWSYLFKLTLSLVGLFSMQNITQMVNGWFGTGNVISEGEGALKAFKDGTKATAGRLGNAVKGGFKAVGAFQGAHKAARENGEGGFKSFARGLQSGIGTTKAGQALSGFNLRKDLNAGRKAGGESFANAYTNTFRRDTAEKRMASLGLQKEIKGLKDEETAIMNRTDITDADVKNSMADKKYENSDLAGKLVATGVLDVDTYDRDEDGNKTIGADGKYVMKSRKASDVQADITAAEKKKTKLEADSSLINNQAAAISEYNTIFEKASTFAIGGEIERFLKGEKKLGAMRTVSGEHLSLEQTEVLQDLLKKRSAVIDTTEAFIKGGSQSSTRSKAMEGFDEMMGKDGMDLGTNFDPNTLFDAKEQDLQEIVNKIVSAGKKFDEEARNAKVKIDEITTKIEEDQESLKTAGGKAARAVAAGGELAKDVQEAMNIVSKNSK